MAKEIKFKPVNLENSNPKPTVSSSPTEESFIHDMSAPLRIKDTKYDSNLQAYRIRREGLEKSLEANQPWVDQAMNGLTRGVVSGLATAVEDFAYIPNIFTQDFEANAIAQAMKDVKEDLREALPIYRKSDDPFSMDSGFIWESLAGVLDSGIGFAIPGVAVSKGISLAGKGISRAGRLGRLGARTAAFRQSALANPVIKQLSTSTMAGVISNDLEGTMMGVEIYEGKIKELTEKRNNGEIDATDEQIKEAAHRQAANFKLHNRAFAITDAFALQGLTRGHGVTRNLIADPKNFKNKLTKALTSPDSLLAQGLTEAGEEISQGVLQKMAEFRIDKEFGLAKDNKSTMSRALEYALDRETLYEGMLGFFGGGFQRVVSESTNKAADFFENKRIDKKIKNLQSLIDNSDDVVENKKLEARIEDLQKQKASFKRQESYEKQQSLIAALEEDVAKAMAQDVKLSEGEAYFNKETAAHEQMRQTFRDVRFRKLAITHFENGTTEKLEESLNNIEDSDLRAHYLGKLKTYEKAYINNSGAAMGDLLFHQYTDIDILQDKVNAINNAISEAENDPVIQDEELIKNLQESKAVFEEKLNTARDEYKKARKNDQQTLIKILERKAQEYSDAQTVEEVEDIQKEHEQDGYDTSEAAEEAKKKAKENENESLKKDSEARSYAEMYQDDDFDPYEDYDPSSEGVVTPETVTTQDVEKEREVALEREKENLQEPFAPGSDQTVGEKINEEYDAKAEEALYVPPVEDAPGDESYIPVEPEDDYDPEAYYRDSEPGQEEIDSLEAIKEEKKKEEESAPITDLEVGNDETFEPDGQDRPATGENQEDYIDEPGTQRGVKLMDAFDARPEGKNEDGSHVIPGYFKRKYAAFLSWLRNWSKDTNVTLDDFAVRLEVDFDPNSYPSNVDIKALEDKLNQQNLSDKEFLEIVSKVSIKAVVVRKQGGDPVIDSSTNSEVFTFLRIKSNDTVYNQTLQQLRQDVVRARLNGEASVTTTFQQQYPLNFDNQPTVDGKAPTNSILEVFNMDPQQVRDNLRVGNSGRNRNGRKKVDGARWVSMDSKEDFDIRARDAGISGKIGMKVRNPNGSYSVAKLNLEKISESDADFIFRIYESLSGVGTSMQTQVPENLMREFKQRTGLSFEPQTMLDLVKFYIHDGHYKNGDKTEFNPKTKVVLNKGVLMYNGNKSVDNFNDPIQRQAFMDFLMENKRYNIKKGKEMTTEYVEWLLNTNNTYPGPPILNTNLGPDIFDNAVYWKDKDGNRKKFSGSIYIKPLTVRPQKKVTESQTNIQQQVKQKLDEIGTMQKSDGKYGGTHTRVSEHISPKKGEGEVLPAAVKRAAQVGTNLDQVARDFFEGKLKAFEEYKDENGVLFFKQENVFNTFIEQLKETQEKALARGAILYTTPVHLRDDEALIAGEPDMLLIEPDGSINIVDFKAFTRGARRLEDDSDVEGETMLEHYTKQQNMYRMLGINMGLNMQSMGLLVFQIKYGNSITVNTVMTQKRVSLQFLDDVNGYRIKRKPDSTFPAAQNANKLPPAEPAPFREQAIIEETVTYRKGGKEYTYTIRGNKIFNDKGKEVYAKASIDRNKIFANLAIKQKRAKEVKVEGNSYVVNKEGKVMSVDTGKIMNRETNPTLYNSIIQKAFPKKSTDNISKTESSITSTTPVENVLTDSQKKNLEAAKEKRKVDPAEKKFNTLEDALAHAESLRGKSFNVNGQKVEFVEYRNNILTGAGQRVFVKVKINGVPVTFYSSTGKGKKALQEGVFYPVLGIEADTRFNGTWINKIDGVEMASYNNSAALASVGAFIDSNFGNLNDFANKITGNTIALQNPTGEALSKEKGLELRKEYNFEYLNSGRETYSNNEGSKVRQAFKDLVAEINNSLTNKVENTAALEETKRQEKLTKEVNDQSQGQNSIEERRKALAERIKKDRAKGYTNKDNIEENPTNDSTCKK
jgi:hypothetical protein